MALGAALAMLATQQAGQLGDARAPRRDSDRDPEQEPGLSGDRKRADDAEAAWEAAYQKRQSAVTFGGSSAGQPPEQIAMETMKLWLDSWVAPLVQELVPELRPAKDDA